jgi:hypothetical protein
MAIQTFPAGARIRRIEWRLERPAQVHRSAYTGKRVVVANPWFGRWLAKVELSPIVGEANVLQWRAFLGSLRGQIHTFRLPVTERPQNSNAGVTVSSTAAQGATSMTLAGAATALLPGQFITVNEQLLQVVSVAGAAVTFEPRLRVQATAGTGVITSEPYALVSLAGDSSGWAVDAGQLYGIGFEVEEAVGSSDTAALPEGPPPSIYEDYALALDFDGQDYWVGGTDYATLASVPGYAFTRSGEQGAADNDGTVDFFAANAPVINGGGYHAYGALTNHLTHSQQLDNAAWTKDNTTVTANSVAAPDGTMTADTVTASATTAEHRVYQSMPSAPARGPCQSHFLKMGTARYASLSDGSASNCVVFDLQAGTVVSQTGAVGAIAALADGWYRCAAQKTGSDWGFHVLNLGTSAANAVPVQTWLGAGETIHTWQAQVLTGSFSDGGPIIATAGATASIGAGSLQVNNPIASDQDYIVWTVIDGVPADTSGIVVSATMTGYMGISSGTTIAWGRNGQACATGDRVVILHRRRGGKDTTATKVNSTVVVAAESGATAFGSPPATVAVAYYPPGNHLSAPLEGLLIKTGTFSDGDLTAILTAA